MPASIDLLLERANSFILGKERQLRLALTGAFVFRAAIAAGQQQTS